MNIMEKDIVDYLNEKKGIELQINELSHKERNETENTILDEMYRRLDFVNSWIEDYSKDIPKIQI